MTFFKEHGALVQTEKYQWSELSMLQLVLARLCIVDYPIIVTIDSWKKKFDERYSEVEANEALIN